MRLKGYTMKSHRLTLALPEGVNISDIIEMLNRANFSFPLTDKNGQKTTELYELEFSPIEEFNRIRQVIAQPYNVKTDSKLGQTLQGK